MSLRRVVAGVDGSARWNVVPPAGNDAALREEAQRVSNVVPGCFVEIIGLGRFVRCAAGQSRAPT
jgi:hypothetical protein